MRKLLLLFIIGISAFIKLDGQAVDMSMKSPYHTVYAFLYYLQPETYNPQKAAETLAVVDTTANRIEQARRLKAILDGGGHFVVIGRLPQDPDYIDTIYSGRQVYPLFYEKLPLVYVEKYGDRWLFSRETVLAIPTLYNSTFPYGIASIVDLFPKSAQKTFLGIEIWKVVTIAIVLLLSIAFYYLFILIYFLVIRFLAVNYVKHLRGEEKLKKRLASFLALWSTIGIVLIILPALMLPVRTMNFVIPFLITIRTFVLIIVFLRIADVFFLYAKEYVEKTPSKMDDQLLPIFIKAIQLIIILGGVLNILQAMNVNITALIAGVSIGGLALALAAQDTVKNFIGSAMIFLDKPFQIGDYIVGSGYEGTIEEVGFRTTRLRNVDKSVIAVPNGNVANDTIVNLGLRPTRRVQLTIGLMYSTPPDKIEQYISGLRQIVETHPRTSKTDYIIRFHSLGASSLDILFRVYVFAPTIADEMEIREEIIYGIVRLAGQLGIGFAFPSTSVYMEQTKEPEKDNRPKDELRHVLNDFLDRYERDLQQKYIEDSEDSGT
jgi:MscS family membrane protein